MQKKISKLIKLILNSETELSINFHMCIYNILYMCNNSYNNKLRKLFIWDRAILFENGTLFQNIVPKWL